MPERADGKSVLGWFGGRIAAEKRKDDRGETSPHVLLGPVYYETHRGGRPMQIEWSLEYSIPASLYQEIELAAG